MCFSLCALVCVCVPSAWATPHDEGSLACFPRCPATNLFLLISHTHPSLPPSRAQPLSFSFGLCVQPSGLSSLQSSHYLSFSGTSNDGLAIASWHLDILPFVVLRLSLLLTSSLHSCSASLISYLPFNPHRHLFTVCCPGSLSYFFLFPFQQLSAQPLHYELCFIPWSVTHNSYVNVKPIRAFRCVQHINVSIENALAFLPHFTQTGYISLQYAYTPMWDP